MHKRQLQRLLKSLETVEARLTAITRSESFASCVKSQSFYTEKHYDRDELAALSYLFDLCSALEDQIESAA